MQRYKIRVAYDGTGFCGFQKQQNSPTIQGALEGALFDLDAKEVQVVGASRTDAGVHAWGQMAHFDLLQPRDPMSIQRAMNARLPKEIRVLNIETAASDFHARFDAKKKTYTYTLSTSELQSPFHRLHSLHFPHPLDLLLMEKASNVLEGTRDFTQFANTTTEKNRPPSNSRTLYNVSFKVEKEFLVFSFTGNGFLYNMVRNLVGALLEVGQKKLSFEDFKALLSPEIRPRCYTTMPPQALCLKEILY